MPDQFERHGRPGKWDYASGGPSRSQQRAAAADDDPVRKPYGRKRDPGSCKQNGWRQHEYEVVLLGKYTHRATCGWHLGWVNDADGHRTVRYSCVHSRACKHCGLIETMFLPADRCPLYPDREEEHQRVQAEARKASPVITRFHRRPVITGPQGYRKPKAARKK